MNIDIFLKKVDSIKNKLEYEGFKQNSNGNFIRRTEKVLEAQCVRFYSSENIIIFYCAEMNINIVDGDVSINTATTFYQTEKIDYFYYLYIEKNMDFDEIIEKYKIIQNG
jgi:hypothetical protein